MDTEITHDAMDPARAEALAAALDVAVPAPLGPFWHQIYFWTPARPADLGRDRHPKVGTGLIPDLGLPRRMWAGGRLEFPGNLRVGEPATRRSRLLRAEHKTGRSGALGLVTLRHEITQGGAVVRIEEQDLVYRAEAQPDAPKPIPPMAPRDAESQRRVTFDTAVLFRYSALTFNGHRIHYDESYAHGVEGYDGLVVHGPMLAHLLMEMAQVELGPLGAFSFRATSALMHYEAAHLCRRGTSLWVMGPDGRQCMQAEATV